VSGPTKVLVIVEDEADMRRFVRLLLSRDPRLEILGETSTAEEAIELATTVEPGLIVLDHGLDGTLTGLAAAPLLKAAAPQAKILLFTAYDMAAEARAEPAIDAFLRKDELGRLLSVVQHLLELSPLPA
jgi:DNA-binding NarL/FixJ family response regulator